MIFFFFRKETLLTTSTLKSQFWGIFRIKPCFFKRQVCCSSGWACPLFKETSKSPRQFSMKGIQKTAEEYEKMASFAPRVWGRGLRRFTEHPSKRKIIVFAINISRNTRFSALVSANQPQHSHHSQDVHGVKGTYCTIQQWHDHIGLPPRHEMHTAAGYSLFNIQPSWWIPSHPAPPHRYTSPFLPQYIVNSP